MWFAASLLFESLHAPPDAQAPLWEESIRLIEAHSEPEALALADQIGRTEQVSYESARGGKVTWRFEGVERLCAIEGFPGHGTELFSRYLRDTEAASLMTPLD